MKLLVAGSRNIKDIDLSKYIDKNVDMIITGGARGIDRIAENYADAHRISKLILRPSYDLYKRGAPLKRNEMMVDMADEILVLWDGKSRGSKHTIQYARKQKKKLCVIILDNDI